MWELCPSDQHSNIFFAFLFLQRLPRDIRVLLTHKDHSYLLRLVAALPGKNKHIHQQPNKKQPMPVPPRPNKVKYPTAPVSLARDSAGLCFSHWSFGKRANNCTAPCSWQGN